ncbi:Helicase PriA essential for oriC/DnaA-independent DNA replication [Desulfosporosinus sp. I2]|uniref:replication restart helicase PriA n=1 Tax=Desulfosporosinus sp. I2 TaxID=1617025 RepID=UPI0005EF3DEC|nr:primosomal protein N' [Desulfosporosinus sp. I2]KJR48725.1 Helicase PriA essential for oriC/DnaA-independent DNA replication [Desulfosporosinus sp. I2]
MFRYAEVLVDVANRRLDQSYHYFIPDNLSVKIGMRVLVFLQNRKVQGLVVNVTHDLPEGLENVKLKPVSEIVDDGSLVPPELIELAHWLAQTTICSIAQSLHTVWPLLKGKIDEWVILIASIEDSDVQAQKWLNPEAFQAITVLNRARRKAISLKIFLKRADISGETLDKLLQQGWIKKEARFVSPYEAGSSQKIVDKQDDLLPGNRVNDLCFSRCGRPYKLTLEQTTAVSSVLKALEEGSSQTILLHGVTGSGKTDVYRELIAQVLDQGGDAILLVPEISLTSQVAQYFETLFGEQVIIMHSGIRPKEKMKAWEDILAGRKRIVIGARSAVFAPLPNLRLIILDEEHDNAYKQDENPKYHARDVARKRMEQRKGVVLLGSATPSLEAYAAAQSGRIRMLTMSSRIGTSVLPPVEIVDMRKELQTGNRSMFSLLLQQKLQERMEKGEQTMLFLNRRGYSTFVICRECGYVVSCPNCDISLTYHTQGQAMRCHYCNHHELPPHACPNCGSRYIRFFGQGTQRVEEELQSLLPEVPILRLDFDTTRSNEAHNQILGKFRRQEASILVGTQMMAKGLDFPNVTLVGVIAADQTLNMPDFRARERTFQLLTQVAGRAGRSVKPGEVVIQTYSPTDDAIVRAAHHDYKGFFWEEIGYRKERKYPPYTHIIRVLLLHDKEDRVIKGANDLGACLLQGMQDPEFGNTELDILGPSPAVLPRLKNQWRWQISVKGTRQDLLRAFLHRGIQRFFQSPASNGIVLNVEVNPLSM